MGERSLINEGIVWQPIHAAQRTGGPQITKPCVCPRAGEVAGGRGQQPESGPVWLPSGRAAGLALRPVSQGKASPARWMAGGLRNA